MRSTTPSRLHACRSLNAPVSFIDATRLSSTSRVLLPMYEYLRAVPLSDVRPEAPVFHISVTGPDRLPGKYVFATALRAPAR